MIRLAVLGEEAGGCLQLAPRVRAASLTEIHDIKELESDDFDAVVLCSTAAPEDTCRVAAAFGKHVLFTAIPESPAVARALMRNCQAHDVLLMSGFSDRFLPSVQAIKQSLDAGQLGDPGLIRIHRWNSALDTETGLSVDIDLAIWMFRELPTEVYAVTRRDIPVDYVQVHLGFPGGGMGLIDVSGLFSTSGDYFSLSLIGSSGAAYADDHHDQQLLFRGKQPVALKLGEDYFGREGDAARLSHLLEFIDAIQQQREPAVTVADAEAALLVAEAARRSIHSGRTARLSGERYEC